MEKIDGTSRKGFTLLELLIAITIIAIMAATVAPMFQRRPGAISKAFIEELNRLTQTAWQRALITRKVHRVVFNIKDRMAYIEEDVTLLPITSTSTYTFKQIGVDGSTMSWPKALDIKQFIIEGFDEMKRFVGTGTRSIWFYIVPNGLAQQVTINAVDRDAVVDGKMKSFGLVLNPFMAQFKVYNAFQK